MSASNLGNMVYVLHVARDTLMAAMCLTICFCAHSLMATHAVMSLLEILLSTSLNKRAEIGMKS